MIYPDKIRLSLDGRGSEPALAFVNDQQIFNSPNDANIGFAWGYGGGGAHSLSMSICESIYGSSLGQRIYYEFMKSFVVPMSKDEVQDLELDLTEFNKTVVSLYKIYKLTYRISYVENEQSTEPYSTKEMILKNFAGLNPQDADSKISKLLSFPQERFLDLQDKFIINVELVSGEEM